MLHIALVAVALATPSIADRPLAPPVPHNVACKSGSTGGSVLATCMTDATVTDKVEFGAARVDDPQGWAHIHYIVLVEKDGTARATIPGLVAGVSYKISARAHHKDSSEGWNEKWSIVTSETAECQAAAQVHDESSYETLYDIKFVPDVATTSWLTMYRLRTPGHSGHTPVADYNLPDYLDNHNSADAYKQLGRWDFGAFCPASQFNECSVTRYCVEVLNTDLVVPVHAVGIGGPTHTSNFANYASCNHGKCHCAGKFDAFVLEGEIETPRSWVDEWCTDPSGAYCQCDEESLKLSNNYTGRWTFYPPFWNCAYMDGQGNPHGGFYNGKVHEASPQGYFYSSPEAGRCADNVEVGTNGCTWKRSPLTYTFSIQQLLDGGVWGGIPDYGHGPTKEEMHSAEIGERMYESIGALPCGPKTTAARRFVV